MKISQAEKDNIFSMIRDAFDFSFKDRSVCDAFHELDLYSRGFEYENGASKYCIMHDDFGDFVVKFTTEKFDWCEREYTNYLAAVERGLGEFFPFTDFLGYYNGVSFFIQERADCDEDGVSSIWYSALREDYVTEEEDENEDIISEKIWDMIDELEDEQRAMYCFGNKIALFDFLDEFCINDLHQGNFGYVDGKLVIIDFSGYGNVARERDV